MLAPETVLQGRYRIVRQLGEGGMGAVYEAIDERLDTTVALKETFFADERLRKQFEREARLLARLHHPALPRVSDHFSEGDGQFLVMQFIPGDDLAAMMSRKRSAFPAHQVLLWADQLLDALDYLHTQDPQIVHRDIKPQNLKLTSRGQIILLDFGLAKGQSGEVSRITTGASIFGYTPNYAPLEQIQGLGTDSRSDLYALAATVYHLITGVKPPDALSRAAALVNGQPDPLRPAAEIDAAIAPEIDEVLRKAMAQNREQRYATALDMRSALHGADQAETITNRGEAQTVLLPPAGSSAGTRVAARQSTVATGETTIVRRPELARRRFLPWVLAAATLLVAGGVVLAMYTLRSRNNVVVQAMPTPTTVEASPAPVGVATAAVQTSVTPQQTPATEQPTPKKVEKTTRVEEKRKSTVQSAPDSQPSTGERHPDRDVPEPPDPNDDEEKPPDRSRRNRPTTQVMPGGVVIRKFPDGSQVITTPDGTRVFIDAQGRRRVLRPNQPRQRPRGPNVP